MKMTGTSDRRLSTAHLRDLRRDFANDLTHILEGDKDE